ncbi:S-adenosyl-L-methionine-dependent methyltransferase [Infundibulicybe gibba]|nr:S-adenosyl-L-methionine-dependent methyltransferase [Infundibulicybe gibba]
MGVDLRPSKLGTKEHWDTVYEEEVANFQEIGDEGEVWFGIASVEKMVEWTVLNVPCTITPAPVILEIGSGNGTLLFALLDAGYAPTTLSGIDYSPDAVKLAKLISSGRGGEEINFTVCDFLNEDPPAPSPACIDNAQNNWDLLLDKGTFDAIALGEKDVDGKLLKPGGYFLITSCNFTEAELQAHFATPKTGLIYHSRIQHPTFTFGGRSGSICSSVAFQKSPPSP